VVDDYICRAMSMSAGTCQ